MKKLRLYKKEKLCSPRAIDILFGPGGADFTHLVYPLRAVAMRDSRRKSDAPVAFLISVPKKRLRHAVDRVLMRRRIREAYRLIHQEYELPEGVRVDLALVYVADRIKSYHSVEKSVHRLLSALSAHYTESAGS
ncbi:MAG: ribonuclease P protein component [Muribaculaceae bacterium]|nr:ribonuclease P protein component [Muribaculaceae bacterium]